MTTELPSTTRPAQDDRIMAALAHVSILLPFWGMVASILIWVSQKEKSQYVRFQALQALTYHLLIILMWIAGSACYMCSFFGTFFLVPFGAAAESEPPPLLFISIFFPMLVFGGMFAGWFLMILYGLVGAVMAVQGKDFRYFIIGNRLERFLQEK